MTLRKHGPKKPTERQMAGPEDREKRDEEKKDQDREITISSPPLIGNDRPIGLRRINPTVV